MKATELLDTIHAPGEARLEKHMEAAHTLQAAHQTHVPALERIITGVCLLEGYKNWEMTSSIASFAAPWRTTGLHANIEVYITIPTVQSWAELIPLLDALERAGADPLTWSSEDTPETYSRQYRNFVLKIDSCHIQVIVTASLPGDTDTCKRIIVGYTDSKPVERPVSRPIYELRCEP